MKCFASKCTLYSSILFCSPLRFPVQCIAIARASSQVKPPLPNQGSLDEVSRLNISNFSSQAHSPQPLPNQGSLDQVSRLNHRKPL